MIVLTSENIVEIIKTIIWACFLLFIIFLFKNTLRELFYVAIWRVKTGAQIKIASFELGASYVPPQPSSSNERKNSNIKAHVDEKDMRFEERRKYCEPNRFLFLVHTITPSKEPGQLYDSLIYLIPHHDYATSLVSVQKVEYFFGKSWGRVFTSTNRANNFAISTSSYGPFVCTAKIYFSDETSIIVWRYIDFEMGIIGNKPLIDKK